MFIFDHAGVTWLKHCSFDMDLVFSSEVAPREAHVVPGGPASELACDFFYHVLSVRATYKARPDASDREINFAF